MHDHVGAAAGERERDFASDAFGAAGDQRGPALQFHEGGAYHSFNAFNGFNDSV